jgi:HAD superfamily hydrolase (TIGR01458 family)
VRAVEDAAAAHRLALPWGFRAGVAGVVKVVVGRLTGIETVLLDLDGTLYVGSQVVPGAPEAVRWLRDQGLTVRFCTNTDSIAPAALADRLARRGFETSEEELVTPVAVAERLFASASQARVLAVAAEGVRQLLGRFLVGPDAPATHVLVADPSYGASYDDLDAAFRALRGRAELVATQVNRIAVRDDGEHLDTGGWVRLLEYATGQTARVLGKPSPEFFTAPLDALGRGPDTALVVGDDLAADIGGGRSVGAATVLVRSGKGDRSQPAAAAEPDAVIDSVADLPGLLRG